MHYEGSVSKTFTVLVFITLLDLKRIFLNVCVLTFVCVLRIVAFLGFGVYFLNACGFTFVCVMTLGATILLKPVTSEKTLCWIDPRSTQCNVIQQSTALDNEICASAHFWLITLEWEWHISYFPDPNQLPGSFFIVSPVPEITPTQPLLFFF